MPILTRLGCNTGGCHGQADGQNGFHLSLFGYDPAGDFQALTRDGGQRRLSRLVPEESLFLAKATGTVAPRRRPPMTVGSPEYRDPPGLGSRRGPGTSRQDARARGRGCPSSPATSGSTSPARGSSASSPTMPTATSAT